MILVDLSAVVITSVVEYYNRERESINDHTVRSIVLSQLLFYKKKFGNEYGNMVICADSHNYWRKDIFPFYKMNRKKTRDKSKFDWDTFFPIFNKIKLEIKESLPYPFVEVDRMEADDSIAILAIRYSAHEKVMIISSDKDLIQVQLKTNGDVKQYSPAIKKLLTKDQNNYSLIEHYIKGDSSDGIPNIFSDDDVFLCDDKRQKPVSKKLVAEAEGMKNPEYICSNAIALDKYKRNRELIDIDYIPEEYKSAIVSEYENELNKGVVSVRKYLIKTRMKNFMQRLGEF